MRNMKADEGEFLDGINKIKMIGEGRLNLTGRHKNRKGEVTG
jgi:hypothetical protein